MKRSSRSNSTSTSSDVRSPTRTSTATKAHTSGNITVTGGAGKGATTRVIVRKNPMNRKRRYYNRYRQSNPHNSGMSHIFLFGLVGLGGYLLLKYFYPNFSLTNMFSSTPTTSVIPPAVNVTPGTVPGSNTITTVPNSGTNITSVVNTPPITPQPVVNPLIHELPGPAQPSIGQQLVNTTNTDIASQVDQLAKKDPNNYANGVFIVNADEWNYYWGQVTGIPQTTDLFPAGNRNQAMTINEYIAARAAHGLSGLGNIFDVGPYAMRNESQPYFAIHRGLGELLYKYGGRPSGFTTMGAGRATGMERRLINRYVQ